MDKELVIQIIVGYLPGSVATEWAGTATFPELKGVERLVHGRRLEALALRYPGGCRRRADLLLAVHDRMHKLEH